WGGGSWWTWNAGGPSAIRNQGKGFPDDARGSCPRFGDQTCGWIEERGGTSTRPPRPSGTMRSVRIAIRNKEWLHASCNDRHRSTATNTGSVRGIESFRRSRGAHGERSAAPNAREKCRQVRVLYCDGHLWIYIEGGSSAPGKRQGHVGRLHLATCDDGLDSHTLGCLGRGINLGGAWHRGGGIGGYPHID